MSASLLWDEERQRTARGGLQIVQIETVRPFGWFDEAPVDPTG
ncbi:hypothetical protein JOE59_001034 [Agromyces cerinus]|nr:hypothetical protein [Agromyces cerinus]MBM7830329.1 hypothetical protein [Agromyces cerinus]